jgi:hypothetical protein
MRNLIKKILKEEKEDRLKKTILNHFLNEYKSFFANVLSQGKKIPYTVISHWVWDAMKEDLEGIFGITKETHQEIYDGIVDEFVSIVTGLPKIGSRVKLTKMDDPYTRLEPGDVGTVMGYNNAPEGAQIHVKWDKGSSLDLIPGEDEWEVLS